MNISVTPKNIAVVGSGISGLSAAWLLSKQHRVSLFEAGGRFGGHANTVDAPCSDGDVPVDTGFIVYNQATYPNLCALFDYLAVKTAPTEMTFAASLRQGAYEYSGTRLGGLFGQPENLLRPRHWRMLFDIVRFFRTAPGEIAGHSNELTLRELLHRGNYSQAFARDHLLPMAAAIWSMPAGSVLDYPAAAFVRFFENHGLLKVSGRPPWRTVSGGSRNYVQSLLSDSRIACHRSLPVVGVLRQPSGVRIRTADGAIWPFDHVVIASHADQALHMLSDASDHEQRLLSCFRYSRNHAVLHTDPAMMPRRKRLWSSWNYLELSVEQRRRAEVTVSYWMNALQNLPTRDDLFVTLNPPPSLDEAKVIVRFDYEHPVFDSAALDAQRGLWSLQGENRTWFCGSYFGSGFHEDGLQAGLAVAEQLGGVMRPWTVANPSGRIHVTAPRTPPVREVAA